MSESRSLRRLADYVLGEMTLRVRADVAQDVTMFVGEWERARVSVMVGRREIATAYQPTALLCIELDRMAMLIAAEAHRRLSG